MTDPRPIRAVESYVDRQAMAEIVGVSVRVLDGWVRDEDCPAHTWGLRLRRFLPSEVIGWLRDRERKAA